MKLIGVLLLATFSLHAEVPPFFFVYEGFENPYIPDPLPNTGGVMVQIKKPVDAATVCVSFTTLNDGAQHTNCTTQQFDPTPSDWVAAVVMFGTDAPNAQVTAISVTFGGETKAVDDPHAGVEY